MTYELKFSLLFSSILSVSVTIFFVIFSKDESIYYHSFTATIINWLSSLLIFSYYNRYKSEQIGTYATIEDQEKLYNVLQEEYSKNLTKNEMLKNDIERMRKLSYTSYLLGSAFDSVENTYSVIVTETYNILKSGKVILSTFDDKEKKFIIKEVAGYSRHYIGKSADNIDEWLQSIKIPVLINDIENDGRIKFKRYTNLGEIFSVIASPILLKDNVIAVLRVESEKKENFTTENLRILNYITDMASLVFESNYYFKEVEKLAITDGITGLYVHKYFIEKLDNEIERFKKYKVPLSLIMMDIDNFKEINDSYGHPFGDKVLIEVAKIIKSELRSIDFPARYGGDEFAVILPHTDLNGAIKVAERLFEKISSFDLRNITERKNIEHKITVSIGVGEFKKEYISTEIFIQKVDEKLYHAKSKGKSRIEIIKK